MERALTTSWLAARLGVDPVRLHVLRRSGELLGVRRGSSQEFVFPAWQFDADWRPLPAVPRIVAAARELGVSDERLSALLDARVGLAGGERLTDVLRGGDEEPVLAALHAEAGATR